MDAKDWYNCGAKIGDLVQNAIDNQDFKRLNEMISDTISSTIDAVQEEMRAQTKRQKPPRRRSGTGI